MFLRQFKEEESSGFFLSHRGPSSVFCATACRWTAARHRQARLGDLRLPPQMAVRYRLVSRGWQKRWDRLSGRLDIGRFTTPRVESTPLSCLPVGQSARLRRRRGWPAGLPTGAGLCPSAASERPEEIESNGQARI